MELNFLIKVNKMVMLNKVKEKVEKIFIEDKLSAREMLLILRELESDATIALLYAQIAVQQVQKDLKATNQ